MLPEPLLSMDIKSCPYERVKRHSDLLKKEENGWKWGGKKVSLKAEGI